MKLIRLGGASTAPCHFLSLGGFEMLLDCGVRGYNVREDANGRAFELLAPALDAVDVEALDLVLVSNPKSMLALPLLTERLGFRGRVLATRMALDFGRLMLEELALEASGSRSSVSFREGDADTKMPMFSLKDVQACCDKVTSVELGEQVALAYGVRVTALSSGFSLGASMWLVESPAEKLAYVGAASGDYSRHPKELDLLPLVDCETLLLTDLKPDRDPHANTERMVEAVLAHVTRVLDRGGVCLIPTSPGGVLFDLIEAIYAAVSAPAQQQQQRQQRPIPMFFLSKQAARALELTQMVGAEWLCQKKVDKLYVGEDAFLHETLGKTGILRAVDDMTAAATAFQSRGIVFLGHPSLKFGYAPEVIRTLGNDSRNAVLLIDPSVDAAEAFAAYRDLAIEKIACPIDPRLSCGDANQFIARCCPRNLIVPIEFTVAPPVSTSVGSDGSDLPMSSHFAQVLPLSELTVAKAKTELLTVPLKPLEPVVIEKPSKYVDGKLDPKLARRAILTEVNGKAAAIISGTLELKRNAFLLNAPPSSRSSTLPTSFADGSGSGTPDGKGKAAGKRKLSAVSSSSSDSGLAGVDLAELDFYRERPTLLLGQVDEEKLADQIRAHNPQAQVYISQGQGDADVFMSIPSLNARVTLWKESSKTLVESESEDARALLTSLVLSQLVVVK